MTGPVCARDGCPNQLPQLATQHADPYCSSTCARKAHGVKFPASLAGAATKRAAYSTKKKKASA